MSNSELLEIYHFSLIHPREVSYPMVAEDFLTTALCGKMTGVIPETVYEDLEHGLTQTWWTVNKSLVTCQECLEWMHS